MIPKPAIYKAEVSTPHGTYLFAALSFSPSDARTDIMTAALAEFSCLAGMLRVKEASKSNRRLIARMWAVKKCQLSNDQGYWGWVRKADR